MLLLNCTPKNKISHSCTDAQGIILFGADEGYVQNYSEATKTVSKVAHITADNIPAVTYDPVNNRIYFSTKTDIYGTNTIIGPSAALLLTLETR